MNLDEPSTVRRTLRPMARLVLLILILSGALPTQDQVRQPRADKLTQRILADLGSGNPPRITRAAFDAGEHGLKKTLPALRKALRDLGEMDHHAALHPRAAVLDALIRLGGRAPAAELEACLGRFLLPAAVILMSRAPSDYETQLVEVFQNHAEHRQRFCWLAAGQVLANLRSQKFTRLALQRMRVAVTVHLIPPGGEVRGGLGVLLGGGGGSTGQRMYLGNSPPFGLYELSAAESATDILVVKGDEPIYGHRLRPDKSGKKIQLRTSWRNIDFTASNLKWIAQLLETDVAKLPMKLSPVETIWYTDDRAYARDLDRIRGKVVGSHRALANRLRIAGLIPANAKIRSPIDLRIFVTDHRPGTTPALPELDSIRVSRRPPTSETKKNQTKRRKQNR